MADYFFYYDESEHSRNINYNTIMSDNYYDGFVVAVVGWRSEDETALEKQYRAFESRYRPKGARELKSTSINNNQIKYGFSSSGKNTAGLIRDFLSFFDERTLLYYSRSSKIEYLISQQLTSCRYLPQPIYVRLLYSLTKFIVQYRPQAVISSLFDDTQVTIATIRSFLEERIEKNFANTALKCREIGAATDALLILDEIDAPRRTEWDYAPALEGFTKFLDEQGICDFVLDIDKESRTTSTARGFGFRSVVEVDSVDSFGIRVADMISGIIAKLMKALRNNLRYTSEESAIKMRLLDERWFRLSQQQLLLYHELHRVIVSNNNFWFKAYAGAYSDDLVALLALLDYFNEFEKADDLSICTYAEHSERYNLLACERLEQHYEAFDTSYPVIPIHADKDYWTDIHGARIAFDSERIPPLPVRTEPTTYTVLSVGISDIGIPTATIEANPRPICYRLPSELTPWAIQLVSFAMEGVNLFPANVQFQLVQNRCYAYII